MCPSINLFLCENLLYFKDLIDSFLVNRCWDNLACIIGINGQLYQFLCPCHSNNGGRGI